jgi:hypothetical protein
MLPTFNDDLGSSVILDCSLATDAALLFEGVFLTKLQEAKPSCTILIEISSFTEELTSEGGTIFREY